MPEFVADMDGWITILLVLAWVIVVADAVHLRFVLRGKDAQIEALEGLVAVLKDEASIHREVARKLLP